MIRVSPDIIRQLRSKASQSPCSYKLSGIAFSNKGEILGMAKNDFRKDLIQEGKYSGRHVERALIERYGRNIATILIMRIGKSGDIRPIDPCQHCAKLAKKMGIRIISVTEDMDDND